MSRATSTSSDRTCSGASSVANEMSITAAYGSGAREKFVNEPSARFDVGMITMPLPVSRCTARQFTSTICPRVPPVSIQSPSSNGDSKIKNSPDTIDPTAFCSARPTTIDVTPRAAKMPATSAFQSQPNSTAMPTMISTNRIRSLKIDGKRSRHDPFSARWKTRWFRALIVTTMSSRPKIVQITRGQVAAPSHAPG